MTLFRSHELSPKYFRVFKSRDTNDPFRSRQQIKKWSEWRLILCIEESVFSPLQALICYNTGSLRLKIWMTRSQKDRRSFKLAKKRWDSLKLWRGRSRVERAKFVLVWLCLFTALWFSTKPRGITSNILFFYLHVATAVSEEKAWSQKEKEARENIFCCQWKWGKWSQWCWVWWTN